MGLHPSDRSGGTPLANFLARFFTPAVNVYRLYTKRLVPMLAAGVAFYFLLGLIPFLFITTAVAGLVFRNRPEALTNLSQALLALLPPGLGESILRQVHRSVEGWETFGVLGVVALFFVAMGLFEAIDWGINGAMGTRNKVGFLKGRLLVLAYITGAIVFFALAAVADYVFRLALAAPALAHLSDYINIPRRTTAAAAFTLFIFVLYVTIPVKPPKWQRCAVVALAVAFVWAVLQEAGVSVTVYISRRHAVYGALAGAALFLLRDTTGGNCCRPTGPPSH